MSIQLISYLLENVLFVNENQRIVVSKYESVFNLSVNDKVYSELNFETDNLTLNEQNYSCLDQILKEITLGDLSFNKDLDILKLVYYFSNEFYVDNSKEKDKHERLHLGAINERDVKYLEVPIVDVLSVVLAGKLGVIQSKERVVNFTCDYDILNFWTTNSFPWAIKRHVKNVWKKPIVAAIKEVSSNLMAKRNSKHNPFLNMDMFILGGQLNNFTVKNYAFMLVKQGDKVYDPYNNFEETSVKFFLKKLTESQVEIGLHPNYNAHYKNTFNQQVSTFKKIFNYSPSNVRNHYLRGEWPGFLISLEKQNVSDDFTFGFADSLLFRGGISRPFKLWNIKEQKPYNVVLHPLTIMEGTLMDYQKITLETAIDTCAKKLQLAHKYGREITLLWHNRSMYKYGFENNFMPELFQGVKDELETLNKNYGI